MAKVVIADENKHILSTTDKNINCANYYIRYVLPIDMSYDSFSHQQYTKKILDAFDYCVRSCAKDVLACLL